VQGLAKRVRTFATLAIQAHVFSLCVQDLMKSARAFYDFAIKYNETAMTWAKEQVGETYPLANADQVWPCKCL
jgi:hypothetical protein